MKAAVYHRYGPPEVLHIADVPKPTPKDNEVLIKLHATTVTSGDARLRGFKVPPGFGLIMGLAVGFRKPRNPILGFELAGEIEAVGQDVTRFKVGDQVVGSAGFGGGTYAEYKCLPEDGMLTLKPADMPYKDVVALGFGGQTTLHYLRKLGQLQAGQSVVIVGASGAVGTYAVQIAKVLGAEVTGVCSTANVALVKALGADHVIDYTQEDFTHNGQTYDLIMDCVGAVTFTQCKNSLKENGKMLLVVAGVPQFLTILRTSLFGRKKALGGVANDNLADLNYLRDLLAAGTIRSVVDRTYPLDQIAEAHRYVDTGRKKGNVVITITS